MAENRQIQNSGTTRRNIRIPETTQTTDAVSTLVYSIRLGEQRASYVRVTALCISPTFINTSGIVSEGVFTRATGGNITRASGNNGSNGPMERSIGNFPGTQPSVNIVANPGTQSIDIMVLGKAATTLNWHVEILSLQNLI